jgi:hypothetical protein
MQNLRIEVLKDGTHITYIDNGTKMFSYVSPIGSIHISKNNFDEKAASDWMSYVIWCMHIVTHADPAPENFILVTDGQSIWYSSILSRYSYTQFYVKNKKPYVIIQSNISTEYERHKKTISQFKI